MYPIADPVAGVDKAFLYITGFAVFFLVCITGVMIYFVIRYRAGKHPHPKDIRGNTKLEVAWMVIPSLIVLSMFYLGWESYIGLRNVPSNAIAIDVRARMFAWDFIYPDGKTSEDLLVVPEGKPVKLNITSTDVIHSLSIPAFRVKVDAVKGLQTYVWFQADKSGTYKILCTEFCGVGHSEMLADLRIVSPQAYKDWLAQAPTKEEMQQEQPEVITGPPPGFDFSRAHRLKADVEFAWQIKGDRMHVNLRAPTQGWVGIGFNPVNRMKGADYILGMVYKGKILITDDFGTGPTKHKIDKTLGGRFDPTNIYGKEEENLTEIGFTMPLDSGDSNDSSLTLGKETIVLLAYGAGPDDFQSRHRYRGKFKVNLSTGAVQEIKH